MSEPSVFPIVPTTTTSQKLHGWPVSGSACAASEMRKPANGRISSDGRGIMADSMAMASVTPR